MRLSFRRFCLNIFLIIHVAWLRINRRQVAFFQRGTAKPRENSAESFSGLCGELTGYGFTEKFKEQIFQIRVFAQLVKQRGEFLPVKRDFVGMGRQLIFRRRSCLAPRGCDVLCPP